MTTTATKERPILFSGAMVLAILNGTKTQTRRVIKPQPGTRMRSCVSDVDPGGHWWFSNRPMHVPPTDNDLFLDLFPKCPYGAPGGHLWVRETWQTVNSEAGPGIAYKADRHFVQPKYDGPNFGAGPSYNYHKYPGDYCMWYTDLVGGASPEEGYHWKPSIHMPRWASRITLEVKRVWVERVQDISHDDCLAEGVSGGPWLKSDGEKTLEPPNSMARQRFRKLWDSINAKRGFGWDANPWVWCVKFNRIGNQ